MLTHQSSSPLLCFMEVALLLATGAMAKPLMVPFTTPALYFNDFNENTPEQLGRDSCHYRDSAKPGQPVSISQRLGGDSRLSVDAQYTSDPVCQQVHRCHISWTDPGEWLKYTFYTVPNQATRRPSKEGLWVDVTVRVASMDKRSDFSLEIWNDGKVGPKKQFKSPGLGMQNFQDVTWKSVALDSTEQHSVKIIFDSGEVNFCSVSVQFAEKDDGNEEYYEDDNDDDNDDNDSSVPGRQPSKLRAPFTTPALGFADFEDTTEKNIGNCGNSAVDAAYTTDSVCINRDKSGCYIAHAAPGEYVSYNFRVDPGGGDDFDVFLRLASASGRSVEVELSKWQGERWREVVEAPGEGWETFQDVLVWEDLSLEQGEYTLKVTFKTGKVNMCSLGVIEPSTPDRQPSKLRAPFTAPALGFADSKDATAFNQGNCGTGSVDAKYTADSVCIKRDRSACSISNTAVGEYVTYNFRVDPGGDDEYEIFLRLSSASDQSISVELSKWRGQTLMTKLETPGEGLASFQDVVWEDLFLEQGEYTLKVMFSSEVNMCSVGVRYPALKAPFTVPALEVVDFDFAQPNAQSNSQSNTGTQPNRDSYCGGGLVNAEYTTDSVCINRDESKCQIIPTIPGDYVTYSFLVDDSGGQEEYEIFLRLASSEPGWNRWVKLELSNMQGETWETELEAPGEGKVFQDVVWERLKLGQGEYNLKITFNGDVNMCSVGVRYATNYVAQVPSTVNASTFVDYMEKTQNHMGDWCGRGGPVDTELTNDKVCLETGDCTIAYTLPGEFLVYRFETEGKRYTKVDITLRVSSLSRNRHFRLEVNGIGRSFIAPGKGWTEFEDIVWKNVRVIGSGRFHEIKILFTTGYVNVCSLSIKYSD